MSAAVSRVEKDLYRRPGRLSVRYTRRGADEPMGRFGGGWQWKVGVQAASGTVLINLLVAAVMINYGKAAR